MKDCLHFARILHGRLHEWLYRYHPALAFYLKRLRNPRAVFLILTPEHENLGDHAIAKAETELLTSLGIPYIEITGYRLKKLSDSKRLKVMNGRTILINGGGNLGTLWFEVELLIRSVVQNNNKSNILIFPSTIYYENDSEGKAEMARSVSIYGQHDKLFLYARERYSYDLMRRLYKNVRLVPDMVLRLDECRQGSTRKGCILCLRSDLEKTLSQEERALLIDCARGLFGESLTYLDMVQPNGVYVSERNQALEKQFDAFRRAELVVTDRLHGMIFAAVTGTPCIVINSKSPKVLGCYEWLRSLPYIRFCEDVRELTQIWQSIPKQEWRYDPNALLPLYEDLKNDLVSICKR